MEGNLNRLARKPIPCGPYGVLDFHGSTHIHHHEQPYTEQGSMINHTINSVFHQSVGNMTECIWPSSIVDDHKGERKTTISDDDEPSFTEDGGGVDGKKTSPWHRMKWTDGMVRHLITAVSYLGEDARTELSGGTNGRRKSIILHKKGKWKAVSKALAERGCLVSPQQCEDKFNDLNKRYKRLTDLLGRGTSCKVVENPAILDLMPHLTETSKEEVRKILSSKQLFYEEMCSYHNGNRIHLPADPALQWSLQLALQSRDDQDVNEDEQEVIMEDKDNEAGDTARAAQMVHCFPKRAKVGQEPKDAGHMWMDTGRMFNQGSKEGGCLQSEWWRSRFLHLEEQKLQIQLQTLELERKRFKWQRFSRKKDRELEKLKMENQQMKLENESMALELKRMELDIENN